MVRLVLGVALFILCIAGCNDNGAKPSPSDRVAPAAVTDLSVLASVDSVVTLAWTATGDDGTEGTAAAYAVRYFAESITVQNWNSAIPADSVPNPKTPGQPEQFSLRHLPDGEQFIAVRTRDEAENWSGLSNVVKVTVRDVMPPASIADLQVRSAARDSVVLRWTAPGDDGHVGSATSYDIRHSDSEISDGNWDTGVPFTDVPAPGPPGSQEEHTFPGVPGRLVYYIAMKSADNVHNWSGLSNVAAVTIIDTTPPGRITDLAGCSSGPGRITLSWTAPGGDGSRGQAAAYDLRYLTYLFSDWHWDMATPITGLPAPANHGDRESFTVSGLPEGETFYFALKSSDEAGLSSVISNVVDGTVGTASLRKLTSGPRAAYGANSPAWSLDGGSIAFSADWDGAGTDYATEIYVMPSGCGGARRVTTLLDSDGYPSWSPDGGRIAFSSTSRDGGGIWTIEVGAGSTPVRLVGNQNNASGCAWSPDGAWIAYSMVVSSDPVISEIRRVPSAGGTPVTIISHPSRNLAAAWSPDGTRLAFVSDRGGSFDIWIANLSGGELVRLTADPGIEHLPTWSPDGTRIAFLSDRSGNFDIWEVPATGGDETQLTSSPSRDMAPSWSPDGTQIAFVSDRTGKMEVWVLTVE